MLPRKRTAPKGVAVIDPTNGYSFRHGTSSLPTNRESQVCPLDRHQPRHHDAADTRKRAGRRHPRHHGVDDAQPEQPPTPPRCMTAHATGRTTLISVRPALPNTPPYKHRSRRSVDAAGEDQRSLCRSSGGRRGNHPTAAPTAVSGGGARAAGRGRSSAARQHQPHATWPHQRARRRRSRVRGGGRRI